MGCTNSTEATHIISKPYWCPKCFCIYKNINFYNMHTNYCDLVLDHNNGIFNLGIYAQHAIENGWDDELVHFYKTMVQQRFIRYDPSIDQLPPTCCPYKINDNGIMRKCLNDRDLDKKYCDEHSVKNFEILDINSLNVPDEKN